MPDKLGPTGDFPQGMISPDDQGALFYSVSVKAGHVVLDFGAPVTWAAMDPLQAETLAMALLRMAANAKGKPITITIGDAA